MPLDRMLDMISLRRFGVTVSAIVILFVVRIAGEAQASDPGSGSSDLPLLFRSCPPTDIQDMLVLSLLRGYILCY